MPAKRSSTAMSGAAAALPGSRGVHVRLCLRLAASLAFVLFLVALLRPRSAPPAAAGPAKVAFLFLARAGLPLDFLWDAFFSNAEEGRLSVYVHSAPGYVLDRSTTTSAYFYGRQLARSVKVAWSDVTMVEAERLLFAAALEDPANQRLVLLSDSCVPLYDFSYIYTYLTASPRSFVDSFLDKKDKRYNPNMSPVIPKERWRKGSQWVTLIRKHAELVVCDRNVFPEFSKHCKMILNPVLGQNLSFKGAAQKEHCIPDEHYVQTLFSIKGLENEVERRTLTYTSWNQSSGLKTDAHPMTFQHDMASLEDINAIKRIDHVNYRTENRTEWCQCNATSAPCFLFTRKFSHGAANRLLEDGVLTPLKSAVLLVTF